MKTSEHVELTEKYGAHNYAPLDVVLSDGDGVWVQDVEGKRYLDMLSAYSALNFGHKNKRIVEAAKKKLDHITLTSRAFYNDELGPFCKELSELCEMDIVLPMNSGAEAVETAIKAARLWGYRVKKVESEKAEIIVFTNNFHGRTITIVGFSDVPEYRKDFGPFTPGFKLVEYGNIDALKAAIGKNTIGILMEPIQGEGGIIIPPEGYLREARRICDENKVLFIADEIQTGLCRTGELFACDHENVKPDLLIIGKSLGGGVVPISAVVGKSEIMGLFTPGSHGSTFGGYPFACSVAREVIRLIKEEKPQLAAKENGKFLLNELKTLEGGMVEEARGRGLFVGLDINPSFGVAKDYCKKLKYEGLLCKDTRIQTIRFAPPLPISKQDLVWAIERIRRVLSLGTGSSPAKSVGAPIVTPR